MEKRWLDKNEAAEYLHTTPARVDQLVEQGELPCSLFDGKELFLIDDLDQFLLAHRKGGTKMPPVQRRGDFLEIRKDCPRDEVNDVLREWESKGHGKVLLKVLRHFLGRSDFQSIPAKVGERLARWCTPRRRDDRTVAVMPYARRISELLFGRILPRHD